MEGAGELAGAGAKGAGEAGAKGAAAAAPEIGAAAAPELAGAAFGGPLNIVSEAASFAPSAVGDIIPFTGASASNILASGGEMAAGLGDGGFLGSNMVSSNASLTGNGFDYAPGNLNPGQPTATGGATAAPSSSGAVGVMGTDVVGSPQPVASATSGAAAPSGISAGAAAPATATAPADATSSWADKLVKGISDSVTKNPLGLALGVGGLGYNIMNGQKQGANQQMLTDLAGKSVAQNKDLADKGVAQVQANQTNAADITAKGKDLTQYLTTGKLPDQYTAQIDQAINDMKTTAISNAAKNGQPTDPTKNTSLAQQLGQIDGQRAGLTSSIAERLFGAGKGLIDTGANVGNASASSLLSGGQNAANLSADLYKTLTNIDTKQAEQTSAAIAKLAQALNTGGTPQKQTATA